MANTFFKIATVAVASGGASTINFTSIPSNYTDLCVKYSARSTFALVASDVLITINGTSSGYTGKLFYSTGTARGSSSQPSGTRFSWGGFIPGANATSNTFGSNELYIPNYASSTNKSMSVDGASENNAAEAYIEMVANLWSNTAAITSITLTPAYGNFAQYSTATLYGIKNS